MKSRNWLLLALPLTLSGCAADESPDVAMMDSDTAAVTAAPAPADMGATAMATTVPMAAVGESGVSGEAILTPAGAATEVSVTLNGLEPGSTHPGHIHQGSCASPGSVVVPLSEITADASGSGTMTTSAAVPTDSVTSGGHIVQYHGDGGAPIACGDVMHMM